MQIEKIKLWISSKHYNSEKATLCTHSSSHRLYESSPSQITSWHCDSGWNLSQLSVSSREWQIGSIFSLFLLGQHENNSVISAVRASIVCTRWVSWDWVVDAAFSPLTNRQTLRSATRLPCDTERRISQTERCANFALAALHIYLSAATN
jgi:hypothetical protein